MTYTNKQLREINIDGYQWAFTTKGIHSFHRKEPQGYSVIECEEAQLSNGDLEFMIEHGMTLSPDRIRKAQKNYLKN
jgi:hypothetical protein